MSWETVIGLEIHAQLATRSKIFSGAPTTYGAEPNSQACAIDLGLPGVLPVLNEAAVRMAASFGLAVKGKVASRSVFARKNYFYPDLPKGYQISQFELPIVSGGSVRIELDDGVVKEIRITRAHLEEDAGKSMHDDIHGMTGIDLNRAGTPLLEIVSEPDMRSSSEASAYMRAVHQLVRYLGICNGNMQEGSFRCDANVSIRRQGDTVLGTRTEIKNLNSFRFIERAIDREVERQVDLLERGLTVTQQTRLYDSERDETRTMRSKEEANDYRYFPDPDLLPLVLDEPFLRSVEMELPELPEQKRRRFEKCYSLSTEDAHALSSSRTIADYFEAVLANTSADPRLVTNWVMGELAAALHRASLDMQSVPISAAQLGELLGRIVDGTISGKIAKSVFEILWQNGGAVDDIIDQQGLRQVSDSVEIEALVRKIVADHPQQKSDYRAGKTKLLAFFVGQAMKASGGKANPAEVNRILTQVLNAP